MKSYCKPIRSCECVQTQNLSLVFHEQINLRQVLSFWRDFMQQIQETSKLSGICMWSQLHPCFQVCILFAYHRGETIRVQTVWQGLLTILQPDHAQSQTHGLQTIRLQEMWQGIPAKGGLETACRNTARRASEPIQYDRFVILREHAFSRIQNTYFSL